MTKIISRILTVTVHYLLGYFPKSVCEKGHERLHRKKVPQLCRVSVQKSALTGQLSCCTVTHLRIYLTSPTYEPVSDASFFQNVPPLWHPPLPSRWKRKQANMREMMPRHEGVFAWYMGMSQPSELGCMLMLYILCPPPAPQAQTHTPTHTHRHRHTHRHTRTCYITMTSLVKMKEVKVPEDTTWKI